MQHRCHALFWCAGSFPACGTFTLSMDGSLQVASSAECACSNVVFNVFFGSHWVLAILVSPLISSFEVGQRAEVQAVSPCCTRQIQLQAWQVRGHSGLLYRCVPTRVKPLVDCRMTQRRRLDHKVLNSGVQASHAVRRQLCHQ